MKKVLAILGIILLLLAGYIWYSFKGTGKREKGPKPVALAVSKHSDVFNQSMQNILDAYDRMAEGFVIWDTSTIAKHGGELLESLNSFSLDELRADTTGIYESALDPLANAKTETENILKDPLLENKRTSLHRLSENLRLLLIIVKYDREKFYWQECPMAFGDDQAGNWLSKTIEVRNPYLGTHHPKYRDGMLHCGGPKDTINFMIPLDTKSN